MNLPPLLTAFVQAKNSRNTDAVVTCFTNDALVHDEGKDHQGLAAIRQWSDEGFAKFQYTIEPTAIIETGEKSILTATVAGNFPGSPVSLDFHFTIKDGKIAALLID